jgi:hypothetical protein
MSEVVRLDEARAKRAEERQCCILNIVNGEFVRCQNEGVIRIDLVDVDNGRAPAGHKWFCEVHG